MLGKYIYIFLYFLFTHYFTALLQNKFENMHTFYILEKREQKRKTLQKNKGGGLFPHYTTYFTPQMYQSVPLNADHFLQRCP